MFFNPSLRDISIHAPTRGATSLNCISDGTFKISIHAPTRGATMHLCMIAVLSLFQSTLPREERHSQAYCGNDFINFNPRSHERSDCRHLEVTGRGLDFNPRSHERSDSNIAQKICLFLYNTDNKYIIR